MPDEHEAVATDFDIRAANYSRNEWHRLCAECLVAHAPIAVGDHVLDAGVGTGFAALAAAERVGRGGRVIGVDLSRGMLERAQAVVESAGLTNVELLQADACDLRQLQSASFDVVVCAAALLYMPVQLALAEWYRLLKPSGTVGFSTMRAGFPQAGQLFRDCAAEFGVRLIDPSAELGSETASHAVLSHAGFVDVRVVAGQVFLSAADFSLAWESNLRSAAHGDVRMLSPADLDLLHARFEQALAEARRTVAAYNVAEVLYAYGRKPDPTAECRVMNYVLRPQHRGSRADLCASVLRRQPLIDCLQDGRMRPRRQPLVLRDRTCSGQLKEVVEVGEEPHPCVWASVKGGTATRHGAVTQELTEAGHATH